MEYTELAGKKAARTALGTWAIGGWMWGGTSEAESVDTVAAVLEKGINVIDTAPVYGFGKSEEFVGKALKKFGREEIVLCTKAGMDWDGDNVFRNASADRIKKEIEDSLSRLQVEYIDLYQVHWPDPLVPVAETAIAMRELYERGVIKAIGVSNYSPEQMDEFRKHAPIHTCQPPYNIFERQIENDVLPYCKQNGILVISYGALCRGLLTGRMSVDSEFTGDDLRRTDPKFQQPQFSQYLLAVEKLGELAAKYDRKLINFAVRWLLDQGVEIPIWGARRPDQVQDMDKSFGWQLSGQDMEKVDEILEEYINESADIMFGPPNRDEI